MAEQILQDCKLWVDEFDLSGDMNTLALKHSAEILDVTAFGHASRNRRGGLKSTDFAHEGLFNSGTDLADEVLFGKIGAGSIMTLSPTDGLDGALAYFMQNRHAEYAPSVPIGEMMAFSVSGQSDGEFVRGTIVNNASRTASGNGTGRQLGAVSATQKMYAALHVISVSGTDPTLDVIIQSAPTSGFSSPVTRFSFGQKLAAASEWATPVNGAIANTHWRVNYTIGGTDTPTFLFIVVIGIQ